MLTPRRMILWLIVGAALASGETRSFSVIYGSKIVGHLKAEVRGNITTVDYDFKNNGRGPTIAETIRTGPDGVPVEWTIKGTSTFGSVVDERFRITGSRAEWTDAAGASSGKAGLVYVSQSGSPWQNQILVKALLHAPGMTLPVLPSGTVRLEKGESFPVQGTTVTRYDLTGIDLTPSLLLVDAAGDWFGEITPSIAFLREGFEAEGTRLMRLAAQWESERYARMEKDVAHRYAGPVRIRNVRIFDAKTGTVGEPSTVVVNGREIAALEPVTSPASAGESALIDGGGGVLVPGMYEMHAHLSKDAALLNLAAGVTSVRDMGNNNEVLDELVGRIEKGIVGGPRVVRSGFIEGKSPFSANLGFVVDSEAKALEAVRWYAARGYWQVKIYNSMDPKWVPAIAAEAHRLGMRVAGHVPAFSTTDAMLQAGYDEITHINQFMLGWVITPTEDTRTLFRLTALKRFSDFDLRSGKVQDTVRRMVEGHKAIDPTLGIHERLMQNRDGQVPPGMVDYLDHMPVAYRRGAMKALAAVSGPAEDRAYREAFEKILATVKMLHEQGVLILFGTDTGGSFSYHRELELYQRAGMTATEILKRATYESARYLGQEQRLGSIEKGKLADFFLVGGDPTKDLKTIKAIRMVVKDGVVYFPSEVHEKFGIRPFAEAPAVVSGLKTEVASGVSVGIIRSRE